MPALRINVCQADVLHCIDQVGCKQSSYEPLGFAAVEVAPVVEPTPSRPPPPWVNPLSLVPFHPRLHATVAVPATFQLDPNRA